MSLADQHNSRFYFLKKNSLLVRHLISWLALTLFILILDPVPGGWFANILGTLLLMLNYAGVYYFLGWWVFVKFWFDKRHYLIVYILLAFFTYLGFDLLALYIIIPLIGGENPYTLEKLINNDTIVFTVIVAAALSAFHNRLAIKKIQVQNEKERSLIVKELNLLRNQFNSHTTMNFLNFCYNNVHQTLPQTADAIELFSDILRYSLKTRPEEKISLKEEIEYINNYIQLQRLLTAELHVNFITLGEIESRKILPRILITLVENAFKHGLYNNPNYPVYITLTTTGESLEFSVKNVKNTKPATFSAILTRSNCINTEVVIAFQGLIIKFIDTNYLLFALIASSRLLSACCLYKKVDK